ncbi:MAG: hypothetical protein MZW92_54375 [Comamonadaceae bacterium]|nr:hypothetical protein [Comamonadaceae bacterium]
MHRCRNDRNPDSRDRHRLCRHLLHRQQRAERRLHGAAHGRQQHRQRQHAGLHAPDRRR